MTRRLQDVIGNALGMPGAYGYGFGRQATFFAGAAEDAAAAAAAAGVNGGGLIDPRAAAAAAAAGYGGYGDPYCGAPYYPQYPAPGPSLNVGWNCGPNAVRVPVGLDDCDAELGPCETKSFEFHPQLPLWKIVQLVISQCTGCSVCVVGLEVVNQNLFGGKGGIPGDNFSPLAVCNGIINSSTSAPCGCPATLTLKNLTKQCVKVGASIIVEGIDRGGLQVNGALGGCF